MEIVEQMGAVQERAYERLYRYIQRECRLLPVEVDEVNTQLSDAFEAMQLRPALFK